MIRRPGSAVGSAGLYAVGSRTDSRPRVRQIGRYRLDQQLLGKGNFARVELATHTVLGIKVAVKIIDKAQITEDYVRRNLGREARIMARLRHPHIAALYEAIETGHLMCLVTELAPGGDLCSYVKGQTDGRLGEAAARPYLKQIVSALVYMHSRGVIHRDLKMENVMLDETKTQVKIVDFGLSNFYGPGVVLQTHCGSPEYAAPELFIPARPYGPEVDVWSLGVIMYGALTGCLPFLSPRTDGTNPQERRHRLYRKIQQGLGQQHWKALSNISSECRHLLLALLTANPDNRIQLNQVEVHPYMTCVKNDITVDTAQPGLDHSHAPKVLIRMSELLSIPASLLKTEVECDDHCEVAAMFYLLLAATKTRKQSTSDLKTERQSPAMNSETFSPVSSTTSDAPSVTSSPKNSNNPRTQTPEREISPSSVQGGGGEANLPGSCQGSASTKFGAGGPEAAGDGVAVDGSRRRVDDNTQRSNQTRTGSGRRLSLKHLCFKGQTSDASLTSRLLQDKRSRRAKRNDDEEPELSPIKEEGKRRPRASGDSCFCMLNYANRWFVECWWNPFVKRRSKWANFIWRNCNKKGSVVEEKVEMACLVMKEVRIQSEVPLVRSSVVTGRRRRRIGWFRLSRRSVRRGGAHCHGNRRRLKRKKRESVVLKGYR